MRIALLIVGLVFCFYSIGFSQSQHLSDSLNEVLTKTDNDTNRIWCLLRIGELYESQNTDTTLYFYKKALKLSEELNEKKFIAICSNWIGIVYWGYGSYDEALEYFLRALKIHESLSKNSSSGIALDGKIGMSYCYGNIGNIHQLQGNYSMAIENYTKALNVFEELGDKNGMSTVYLNIGIVYWNQKNYRKAIKYYLQALKIFEEFGNKNGMSTSYINIGVIEAEQGNYDNAIEYYQKALNIQKELGDKKSIAAIYGNIADLNIFLADSTSLSENQRIFYLNKAVMYGLKMYEIACEVDAILWQNNGASVLQKAYTKLGKYKDAIKYAEVFIATKDSMFSEEKTKALTEMEAKYESEKKEQQIALQKAELEKKDIEVKQQQTVKYAFVAGFILVLLLSIVISRSLLQKKKANIQLALQNVEINQQKEEITAQRDHIHQIHEDIESSILYARRIQQAILPKNTDSILGEHFIIFKPKDLVSGDFYWSTMVNDWTIVTVADCTGHGVPGAFMSMLGVSFLNEIVRKKEVTNAASILNQLRNSIIEALQQTGEAGSQKDGMDMSLAAINKSKNQCFWAGANNLLWIIRNNTKGEEFEEKADMVEFIKGDSMPVAVHIRMDEFTNHEVQLEKGDKLYMFSDGFPDQFGGAEGKKFMSKKFKRLIAETSIFSMKEQGIELEKAFQDWIHYEGVHHEQIDDVTVLGVKI